MMTSKDLKALAETLNECKPPKEQMEAMQQWKRCVRGIITTCSYNNPRFDRFKFKLACGWNEEID